MLGAIAGDVIGSVFEWNSVKTTDFPLFSTESDFTDDSVLTVATAEVLLGADHSAEAFGRAYHAYGNRYPGRGYGGNFHWWLSRSDLRPYGSFGNGSAMRASPAGIAASSRGEAMALGAATAAPTHDHPEGIKGAQAVTLAIRLARDGATKDAIRRDVTAATGYDLTRSVASIRDEYTFDVTCQGSVPEALLCFLEASSFEEAVRLAISLGGDADTQAAVAGGIAEAFYGGVPEPIAREVRARLPREMLAVVDAFNTKFPLGG